MLRDEIDYAKLKNTETVSRVLQPPALMFSEYYFYLAALSRISIRKGNLTTQRSIPHHLPPDRSEARG